MKKITKLCLTMFLTVSVLCGCSSKKVEESKENKVAETITEVKKIKIYVPDGLPALSVAKLIVENPIIDKNVDISYEVAKTADVLSSKVMAEEADIAIVPSNLAAQAYNKALNYRLAGTTGWGSLFIVASEDIKDLNSLKEKEIYNIGKGLTPDIVFRYILSQNGINPDNDIKTTYLNAATELAPAFISGKSKIAVMPEPVLTNVLDKKNDSKIVFDLNSEWKKITKTSLGFPQASIIIKADVLKDKKFIDEFLKQLEDSVKWANSNGDKLAEYSEKLQLSVNKEAVAKCVNRANLKYVNINDSKDEYNKYFKVLLDFEPKSIGGKIPDEGFYIQK